MIFVGSESVMRLLDIDGDGLQDVVFGAAATADLASISTFDPNKSLKVFCEKTGEASCLCTANEVLLVYAAKDTYGFFHQLILIYCRHVTLRKVCFSESPGGGGGCCLTKKEN